jgi:hypothetical protein
MCPKMSIPTSSEFRGKDMHLFLQGFEKSMPPLGYMTAYKGVITSASYGMLLEKNREGAIKVTEDDPAGIDVRVEYRNLFGLKRSGRVFMHDRVLAALREDFSDLEHLAQLEGRQVNVYARRGKVYGFTAR